MPYRRAVDGYQHPCERKTETIGKWRWALLQGASLLQPSGKQPALPPEREKGCWGARLQIKKCEPDPCVPTKNEKETDKYVASTLGQRAG
jgi:hypothetical protein